MALLMYMGQGSITRNVNVLPVAQWRYDTTSFVDRQFTPNENTGPKNILNLINNNGIPSEFFPYSGMLSFGNYW